MVHCLSPTYIGNTSNPRMADLRTNHLFGLDLFLLVLLLNRVHLKTKLDDSKMKLYTGYTHHPAIDPSSLGKQYSGLLALVLLPYSCFLHSLPLQLCFSLPSNLGCFYEPLFWRWIIGCIWVAVVLEVLSDKCFKDCERECMCSFGAIPFFQSRNIK